MEAVVHQPFGDVNDVDAHRLEGLAVDDELVRVQALLVPVDHSEAALFQPLGHVVGIQDGHLGRQPEALTKTSEEFVLFNIYFFCLKNIYKYF